MTTTALFLLRCKQIHLTLEEIDELSVGFIYDLFTESANDYAEYNYVPTQEDYDKF